jgi:hypothetical protein
VYFFSQLILIFLQVLILRSKRIKEYNTYKTQLIAAHIFAVLAKRIGHINFRLGLEVAE